MWHNQAERWADERHYDSAALAVGPALLERRYVQVLLKEINELNHFWKLLKVNYFLKYNYQQTTIFLKEAFYGYIYTLLFS